MDKIDFELDVAGCAKRQENTRSITGEAPAYFAGHRMRDFNALGAAPALPPAGRYLDFGSGVGASAAPVGAHLPQAWLVCTAVAADRLAPPRQTHGGAVERAWMPDGTLPFSNAARDGAFAGCVLGRIAQDHHALARGELKRVLRPAGLPNGR